MRCSKMVLVDEDSDEYSTENGGHVSIKDEISSDNVNEYTDDTTEGDKFWALIRDCKVLDTWPIPSDTLGVW